MGTWAVAEAKSKFSEVIETAQHEGAQGITRNGKLVGYFVSPHDWETQKHTPGKDARTMSEFFKSSPLVGANLDLRRSRSKARKIEL